MFREAIFFSSPQLAKKRRQIRFLDFLHARYCRSLWLSLVLTSYLAPRVSPVRKSASWIIGVHKVWYSVSNFYSKNSPLQQPCSHGAFRFTSAPHKIRLLDFLHARYCRSLRFRWCSLHTSLPGFHPSGNPLYSVKVLVCSCVYSDSVSVRDKERYVYNSTCLKCSRFCTALSSIAFF